MGSADALLQELDSSSERAGRPAFATRLARSRYQKLIDLSPDGFFDWDLNAGSAWFSPRIEELLPAITEGGPRGFARLADLVAADERTRFLLAIRRHLEQKEPLDVVCRFAGGLTCRIQGVAERDPAARPYRLVGVLHDISSGQRLFDELQESAELWRGIVDALPTPTAVLDARGELIEINRAWRETSAERGLIGLRYGFGENYLQLLDKAVERCGAAAAVRKGLVGVLAGSAEEFVMDYQASQATVGDRRHLWRVHGRALEHGGERYIIVSHADLSSSGLTTESAASNRHVLEHMLKAVPTQIAYVDREGVLRHVNAAYERFAGVPGSAIVGQRLSEIVSPGNWQDIEARMGQVLSGLTVEFFTRVEADGEERELLVSYVPQRDEHGVVQGFTSITHDVTAERRLEGDLRQAKNVDAIGQLTGGIAHDFNHFVKLIVRSLQRAECASDLDAGLRENVSIALRAALSASDLTRRLLALARQQHLDPVTVDCNALLTGLRELLDRSLSEKVALEVGLDPELWACRVDPSQLESAVLNLTINARDAMPDGGCVVIATRNDSFSLTDARRPAALSPGDYIVISVQDNGIGMSPETARRAFEPFFTTKGPNKGTGLGLAMVNGLLKQSGGAATIDSAPGAGTTVRLYLPRAANQLPD